jgi:hypothetical protein
VFICFFNQKVIIITFFLKKLILLILFGKMLFGILAFLSNSVLLEVSIDQVRQAVLNREK